MTVVITVIMMMASILLPRILTLYFLLKVSIGITTIYPEDVRMEICPGSTVQYFCHSTGTLSSITWGFICPDQEYPGYSETIDNNSKEIQHDCATDEGEMFSFIAMLTYEQINSTTQSNMSITVLRSDYSMVTARSLRIDCEDSGNYRCLDMPGWPSPPSSLSYNYSENCTDSHATVDIHWLPPMDARTTTEQYNLTITPMDDSYEEITTLLNSNIRNFTTSLEYNMTYFVDLFSTSCDSFLKSESISMEVYIIPQSNCRMSSTEQVTRGHQTQTTKLKSGVTTGIDDRLRAVIGGASAVIALLLISVVVIALIILLRLKLSLLPKHPGQAEAPYAQVPSYRSSDSSTPHTPSSPIIVRYQHTENSSLGIQSPDEPEMEEPGYSVVSELTRNNVRGRVARNHDNVPPTQQLQQDYSSLARNVRRNPREDGSIPPTQDPELEGYSALSNQSRNASGGNGRMLPPPQMDEPSYSIPSELDRNHDNESGLQEPSYSIPSQLAKVQARGGGTAQGNTFAMNGNQTGERSQENSGFVGIYSEITAL